VERRRFLGSPTLGSTASIDTTAAGRATSNFEPIMTRSTGLSWPNEGRSARQLRALSESKPAVGQSGTGIADQPRWQVDREAREVSLRIPLAKSVLTASSRCRRRGEGCRERASSAPAHPLLHPVVAGVAESTAAVTAARHFAMDLDRRMGGDEAVMRGEGSDKAVALVASHLE
jgi:hypothetical protein